MRQICTYWGGGQRRVFTSEELVEICNTTPIIDNSRYYKEELENILASYSDTYKEFILSPSIYNDTEYDGNCHLQSVTHPTILLRLDIEKASQITNVSKDDIIQGCYNLCEKASSPYEPYGFCSFDASSMTFYKYKNHITFCSFTEFIAKDYITSIISHELSNLCLWEDELLIDIPFSVEYIYDAPYSNTVTPMVSYNKEMLKVDYISKIKDISPLHVNFFEDENVDPNGQDAKKLYLYIIQNFDLSPMINSNEPIYIGKTWVLIYRNNFVVGDLYLRKVTPSGGLLLTIIYDLENHNDVNCTIYYDGRTVSDGRVG